MRIVYCLSYVIYVRKVIRNAHQTTDHVMELRMLSSNLETLYLQLVTFYTIYIEDPQSVLISFSEKYPDTPSGPGNELFFNLLTTLITSLTVQVNTFKLSSQLGL